MNQVATTEAPLPAKLADQLDHYEAEFASALPAEIPVDKFKRVVLTAINLSPELAKADRRTLFNACVRSAFDGLYPDGREAALVIFRKKHTDNNGREEWIDAVQYMPMISGIRKQLRNSGEVLSATSEVVYENDEFGWKLGDDPGIEHIPNLEGDRGEPRGAYAIIKLRNGEVLREYMTKEEIEAVRKVSRSGQSGASPWSKWWGEMARKTVLRRCAKAAPTSSTVESMWNNDDRLLEEIGNEKPPARPRKSRAQAKKDPDPAPAAEPEQEPEQEAADEHAGVQDAEFEEVDPNAAEEVDHEFNVVDTVGEVVWEGDDADEFGRQLVERLEAAGDDRFKMWDNNEAGIEKLKGAHPKGYEALSNYIETRRKEAEPKAKPKAKANGKANGKGLTMEWTDGTTEDFPATKKGLENLLVALAKRIEADGQNFYKNEELLVRLGEKNTQYAEQIERYRMKAAPGGEKVEEEDGDEAISV